MDEDLLALFRKTGALLDGHFVLRSGLHSRQYFPSAATALDELVQGKPPFAMVAMDVVNGEVQFYAYGPDSNIVQAAVLDDEGPKAIPQVCSACHGGLYDAAAKHVVNASFLPFDVSGFKFASAPGFTL